jgi:hypothetical protein
MNLADRIAAFDKLGKYLHAIDAEELTMITERARNENSWFVPENVKLAIQNVGVFLTAENLKRWVADYSLNPEKSKMVALVMAGNIPLVGFHDFLSVLISGHNILIKTSSKDSFLPKYMSDKLIELEPRFASKITYGEQLKNFDAVIATGSDNSSRYFEYYFGKYPHIIRKNRTSCAVLSGFETQPEIEALGRDVFTYFGLGCRNVAKLYVPAEYDFSPLLKSWELYHNIINHHKYNNNYDYQKSILLVNRIHFYDSGFVLLQQNERLVSPISVLYYEYYTDYDMLKEMIAAKSDKIQCVVGNMKPANVNFGQAQSPQLWDYADQIDTLKFLESLN